MLQEQPGSERWGAMLKGLQDDHGENPWSRVAIQRIGSSLDPPQ